MAGPSSAQPNAGAKESPAPLEGDPLLGALVAEALARRPEIAAARARLDALRERVPQAGALSDPILTLGIQNDGFQRIEIGRMETSYGLAMASQTLPWFGKRALRSELAALDVRSAQADLARIELSAKAEVERAYLEVLLARGRLLLLARLEILWGQAEELAQVRYESGEGAQSDILRAQLERTRLRQRRWAYEAQERRRFAELNRLRGHPLGDELAALRSLAYLPDPPLPEQGAAFADAEAHSPELEKARLAILEAERRVELARKDVLPDPTVTLGIMPRGGPFDPMWQASVSVPLPIWAGRKQARATAENRARRSAAVESLEGLRRLLEQRVSERRVLLEAARRTNELFRKGLLVQSEAAVQSALAQYQVGRSTFASALEALAGYVADENGFFDSIATAQRLAIAERELSLEEAEGPAAGAMGASAPAAAAMPAAAGPTSNSAPAPGENGGGSTMPSRM